MQCAFVKWVYLSEYSVICCVLVIESCYVPLLPDHKFFDYFLHLSHFYKVLFFHSVKFFIVNLFVFVFLIFSFFAV